MVLFASWCFDGSRFHRNCLLEWKDGSIRSCKADQACPSGVRQVGGVLPGFINLHAHLELTSLRGQLPRHASFPVWVSALRSQLAEWSQETFQNSVRLGIKQSLRAGTTTVVDVGNSGASAKVASEFPLRTIALQEVLGLNEGVALERLQAAGSRALCPHSLYGTHEEVFRRIAAESRAKGYPFTFHLEESQGEHDLYCLGSGELREWLDSFVPGHPFQAPGASGFERAVSIAKLDRAILAHGNFLSLESCQKLAALDATVVHCPQSHGWFGHGMDPVETCRQAGLRLALGSDSLASADSLSLWEQMSAFHAMHPNVSLEDMLAKVCSIPGRALDPSGLLGTFQEGAPADIMAVEGFEPFTERGCFTSIKTVQVKELWIRGEQYEEA